MRNIYSILREAELVENVKLILLPDLTSIQDELSPSVEVDQEEIKRRCQALSGVDKISSSLSPFEKEGS